MHASLCQYPGRRKPGYAASDDGDIDTFGEGARRVGTRDGCCFKPIILFFHGSSLPGSGWLIGAFQTDGKSTTFPGQRNQAGIVVYLAGRTLIAQLSGPKTILSGHGSLLPRTSWGAQGGGGETSSRLAASLGSTWPHGGATGRGSIGKR